MGSSFRASTIIGSVDAATAASPPSISCLRTAGSSSFVPLHQVRRPPHAGRLPVEDHLHEGSSGPISAQVLFERAGDPGNFHVLVDGSRGGELEAERIELRVVIAGQPLAVGLLDLGHVLHDPQAHSLPSSEFILWK